MTVLIDRNTRLICQGMTGWAGTYHTDRMVNYGTHVVAGVTPGKGGRAHLNLPVFNTVNEAASKTGANASIVFVPPDRAAHAIIDAIEAELPLVVVVTERIPVLDMVRVREALRGVRTTLVGPNSQGVLSPGECKVGVMATDRARKGGIGIASRSASLTSKIVSQLTSAGLGQSTTIGIGGDPVHGLGFVDCLKLFSADPETKGVILIGEIGGSEEEEAADFLSQQGLSKPVVALVVGRHAPPQRRMGHAGTLMLRGETDADSKIAVLRAAGVKVAPSPHLVGEVMRQALAEHTFAAA